MGRINLNKVVMDTILLLPLTVLFQKFVPVVNRVIFFFVIASLLYIVIRNIRYIQGSILLLIFIMVYFFSIIVTGEVANNTNEYFYLLFFMLFATYTINRYDYIKRYLITNTTYIRKIVILWNLCVITSMFFKSSYSDGFFSLLQEMFLEAQLQLFLFYR